MEVFIQTAGWIGAILIVLACFLVSHQYVEGKSKKYQLINIFGSLGIGVNVFHQQAWPAVTLQIMWIAIAIMALILSK